MQISAIQAYVSGRLQAHPQFAAKGIVPVLDDGTYPKIPGLEAALRKFGLALIVWRVGSLGLVDAAKTGLTNMNLHVAVVIQEIGKINRGPASAPAVTPSGILPEDALQYVIEAIAGYPKHSPPGTAIVPHHDPFSNLGTVNGASTIIVNFVKQHRIAPI